MKLKPRKQRNNKKANKAPPSNADQALLNAFELCKQDQYDQAATICQLILQQEANNHKAMDFLGQVYTHQGKYDEAVAILSRAIMTNPNEANYYDHLGAVLVLQDKIMEAVKLYQKAIQLAPKKPKIHNNLGYAFGIAKRPDLAEQCYRAEIENDPSNELPWTNLCASIHEQGKFEEGQAAYDEAITKFPQSDALKVKRAVTLPQVLESKEAIPRIREQFEAGLDQLMEEEISLVDPNYDVKISPFYLSYHGRDNKHLMTKLARMYEQACPALLYEAQHCGNYTPSSSGKIRIGFVSQYFYNHSVGRSSNLWIQKLAQEENLDVFVISAWGKQDATLQEAAKHTQFVQLPLELAHAREAIAKLKLDVIMYLDIGMATFTYYLAYSRLAPVQCVIGGHPETTGLTNMDYFVSSKVFEPENAQDHYSETLSLLDKVIIYMEKPVAQTEFLDKATLGLPEDKHLYVSPMTLYKFHPEFDDMMAEILRKDPLAVIVLFRDKTYEYPVHYNLLKARLERTIPDVIHRVLFLDWMQQNKFPSLLYQSDVLLDPIHFGSGTTTLSAAAIGTPMVTTPGQFLRDRAVMGFYNEMGVTDCIAKDREEYVDLAIRIASEADFRTSIKDKILASNDVLYGDNGMTDQLAAWFGKAIRQSS